MQTDQTGPDREPAHDILAAEAFAVPAPDPRLERGRVEVPEDPSGISEPHDILAADEFPMPAAQRQPATGTLARATASPWRAGLGAAGALLALVGLKRRRG
jgi:hypothetical protein